MPLWVQKKPGWKNSIVIIYKSIFATNLSVLFVTADSRDSLVVETKKFAMDVPYGDYFHVETRWTATGQPNGCKVSVKVGLFFIKSTILKGFSFEWFVSGLSLTQGKLKAVRSKVSRSPWTCGLPWYLISLIYIFGRRPVHGV